ncbi:hypothetical protein [Paramylibacter kogurei]|nr:hypothetical protein [Amylibacter kogurei]
MDTPSQILKEIQKQLKISSHHNGISVQIGIPAKKWDGIFEYHLKDNKFLTVDANLWSFELEDFDGKVCLKAFPPKKLNTEYYPKILKIILIGELGEKNFFDLIDKVKILNTIGDEAFSFKELRERFSQKFLSAFSQF